MFDEQLLPIFYVFQGGGLRYIINEDHGMSVFEVGWDEAAIALLSSCVPHLQPIDVPVSGEVSYIEIDSNCGLNHGKDTV